LPLPDPVARKAMIQKKLEGVNHSFENEEQVEDIVKLTDGYSAADLVFFCKEAAMMPLREIPTEELLKMPNTDSVRKVNLSDFTKAKKNVQPSVSKHTILEFEAWQREKAGV